MRAYNEFANFYDATMGDRAHSAEFVRSLIKKHAPRAQTLLELACGTGSVLKRLSAHYDIVGLDLSSRMLRIARAKLPGVELHRADMSAYDLGRTFDTIICVFDSINHLMNFSAWEQTFRCTAKHLVKGGLFIFDINTSLKLRRHAREPAWVKSLDSGTLIMKVTDGRKGISNWNIKVFERRSGRRYCLHEEEIREISFPIDRIGTALARHFRKVRVVDPARSRPTSKSERLWFICTRA